MGTEDGRKNEINLEAFITSGREMDIGRKGSIFKYPSVKLESKFATSH